MPLTPEFYEVVKALDKNWSMGVELVSPLLYSLVRSTRPRRALEVGAGYSSLFILEALADNATDHRVQQKLLQGHVRSDRHKGLRRLLKGPHPLPLAQTDFYRRDYEPKLHVIDDGSHPATSAPLVQDAAQALGLAHYLEFHDGLFQGMSRKLSSADLPLDFVWFDCGGLREFLAEYWDLINPLGGLLLIHSTLSNRTKMAVLDEFRRQTEREPSRRCEILSLHEPHKWRQNSFTILRRTPPELEKTYTMEDE